MNIINGVVFEIQGIELVITGVWFNRSGITSVEFQETKPPYRTASRSIDRFMSLTGDQFGYDGPNDLHEFYKRKGNPPPIKNADPKHFTNINAIWAI